MPDLQFWCSVYHWWMICRFSGTITVVRWRETLHTDDLRGNWLPMSLGMSWVPSPRTCSYSQAVTFYYLYYHFTRPLGEVVNGGQHWTHLTLFFLLFTPVSDTWTQATPLPQKNLPSRQLESYISLWLRTPMLTNMLFTWSQSCLLKYMAQYRDLKQNNSMLVWSDLKKRRECLLTFKWHRRGEGFDVEGGSILATTDIHRIERRVSVCRPAPVFRLPANTLQHAMFIFVLCSLAFCLHCYFLWLRPVVGGAMVLG